MFKKLSLAFLLVILFTLTVLYVISPVEPIAWSPDLDTRLKASFEQNQKLDNVTIIGAGQLPEAEDIAFDQAGWLHTGLIDGRIVKLHPDNPSNIVEIANTQGRPLGLRFDDKGNLVVADAVRGILSITPKGGISVLVDNFEGRKLLLIDHLDIAKNGDIYFSDASAKFDLTNYLYDFIEASRTGAVYKYSMATQETTLLMDNIFFSNGVALGPNDDYLLVAETGRARILKYHLTGILKGQTEVFIDALPAMPDNLYYDDEGTVWAGLVTMRDWRVEKLAPYPTIRRIIGGIGLKWLKPQVGYGFAIGLNLKGKVTHNLQTAYAFTHITGVVKQHNKLYLGSLEGDSVAVYDLGQASN